MPIRLAENFRAVFYAPLYAAVSLGFYAREGVQVDLIESSVPGDGVSALLNDRIDVTWGGPMRVMKAHDLERNAPLVCFCEVVARDPFFLVGAHGRTGFELKQLPSLRFAAVSEVPTPWMCLQDDLREQGMDPSQFVRQPDQSMAANFEALCEGRIDVVQLFEPYVSMALHRRVGTILYEASGRGPTVYTTFVATRSGLKQRRDEFAAMIRAIGRVQEWLAEHKPDELAEITAPFFPQIERDILTNSLRRYAEAGIWARSPEVSRQGFARLGECLLSGGFISHKPVYEQCVDQSLS
jgi:NitT/TauT family transport system substrate-binding protein